MKKLLYSLLILVFLITSCEKKDEETTPVTPPPTEYILDRIELMSTSETLQFHYDTVLQKYTSVTIPNNKTLEYTYNTSGNIEYMSLYDVDNNLIKERKILYNTDGTISEIENKEDLFGTGLELQNRIIYTYNSNGNIQQEEHQNINGLSLSSTFLKNTYNPTTNHILWTIYSYYDPLVQDTIDYQHIEYETNENGEKTEERFSAINPNNGFLIPNIKIEYIWLLGKPQIEKHYTFDPNINWSDNLQVFLGDYVESHDFTYDYENFDAKLLPFNRSMDLLIFELIGSSSEVHGALGGHTFSSITGPSYMLHYYYAEL